MACDQSGWPVDLLHQGVGARGRFGLDEQVNVLRHQNPADEQKALLLVIFPEKLDEQEAEALAVKDLQATIDI